MIILKYFLAKTGHICKTEHTIWTVHRSLAHFKKPLQKQFFLEPDRGVYHSVSSSLLYLIFQPFPEE